MNKILKTAVLGFCLSINAFGMNDANKASMNAQNSSEAIRAKGIMARQQKEIYKIDHRNQFLAKKTKNLIKENDNLKSVLYAIQKAVFNDENQTSEEKLNAIQDIFAQAEEQKIFPGNEQ